MNNKTYQIDMCTGAVLPKLLKFALPMMATNILQLMFSAADSIVVGRFAGEAQLAAVGAVVPLISLLTNLFLGLSVGANVTAAKCYGSDDEKGLSETLHTAITLGAVVGLFLTGLGLVLSERLLVLMKTPDDVLEYAVLYLRIYFLGMTSMTVYNFGSAVLRAVGDTKRPLLFLIISGSLNVALNLLFVICFKWGVAGVAVSTILTQTLSAYLLLICLSKESNGLRFEPKKLGIRRDKIKSIVMIGLPAGFQSSMYSVSNVVIQSSINSFGKTVIAANTAAVNFEDMIYFTLNAVMQSVTSFTGQNMGKGDMKRVRHVQVVGQAVVVTTGAILILTFSLLAPQLLGIYIKSPLVITYGVERLRILLPLYFFCGVMEVFIGGMQGIGHSLLPAIVSLVGICALRVGFLTLLFPLEAFHKVTYVYALYPATWIITSIAEGICFIIVYRHTSKQILSQEKS